MSEQRVDSEQRRVAFGLFGAGGCARAVMPVLLEGGGGVHISRDEGDSESTAYFVDREPAANRLNGVRWVSESQYFALRDRHHWFNVAVGDSRLRERIATMCIERGAIPRAIRAKNSIVYDEVEIGAGAVLCANTVITSNVKIGRFFQLNLHSYVEHDCVIGDFVTFAPGVHCNGHVHIGDFAYIGSGAILRNGTSEKPLQIGAGAVVGMGAVVTKDVAPQSTVVGNPARPLNRGA